MSDLQHDTELLNASGNWKSWDMGSISAPGTRQGAGNRSGSSVPTSPRTSYQQGLHDGEKKLEESTRLQAEKIGFSEGYEKGYAAAQNKVKQSIRAQTEAQLLPVKALINTFNDALDNLSQDMSSQLVDLAMTIGRQLALDTLSTKPEVVLTLIRELMENEYAPASRPRLILHPEDLALVEEHLNSELEAMGWQLRPDERLTRGGCRLHTQCEEIDATWESRCGSLLSRVRRRESVNTDQTAVNDDTLQTNESEGSAA